MSYYFSKSILRTPVKSINQFHKILLMSRNEIYTLLKNDIIFQYGLFVASPNLYNTFLNIDITSDKFNKLILSCLKYYSRMTTRCTPFGVFAGINTIVHCTDNYDDHITREDDFKVHTRMDSNIFNQYFENIIKNIDITKFKYYTNSTFYRVGKKGRYIEYTINHSNRSARSYTLTEVKIDPILHKIIKQCKNGLHYNDIVKLITTEGFDFGEAIEFINSLIDSQLLISELAVSYLGGIPEFELINKIKNNNDISHINMFKEIVNQIKKINNISDIKTAFDLSKQCYSIHCNVANKTDILFHKEIYFNDVRYDMEHSRIIEDIFKIFKSIGKKPNIKNSRISMFKELYSKKYGDTIQKLSDVLDIESGIGYGIFLNTSGVDQDSIIKNIDKPELIESNIALDENELFLLKEIKLSLKRNTDVEIDLKKIPTVNYTNTETGATTSAMVSLFKDENNRDVAHVTSIGSDASRLIGRYTNGNKSVLNLVKEIAEHEKLYYKDFKCIEIDYIPESSLGNIIQREYFRDYRISILGGVSEDLSFDDLYIKVDNGKINIVTLNNENILPFFSNAFNISHPKNIPLFEFLVDVKNQYEYNNIFYIDLRKLHSFFDHIPRVTIKNIIVHKASWFITLETFNFSEKTQYNSKTENTIKEILENMGVGPNITFSEGDNELVINIKNSYMLEILFRELKKKKAIIVSEFLYDSLKSKVINKDNEQIANEVLLFKKNPIHKIPLINISNLKNSDIIKVRNQYMPGSEWIYFKIYIGNKTVDQFLIDLNKLYKKMKKEEIIEKFFYIKYFEDSFQLRIRFKVNSKSWYLVFRNVLQLIKIYINQKRILNFTIEPYEREIIRYGGSQIELFESIFEKDSLLSIYIIKKNNNGLSDNNIPSWIYCMEVIYRILNETLIAENKILTFISWMKSNFDNEFNSNKNTTKLLNAKFEKHKDLLQNIIVHGNYILCNRELEELILKVKEIKYKNIQEFTMFLNSIFHMHIIRVVRSNNRRYEFVIYNFLLKLIKIKTFYKKEK